MAVDCHDCDRCLPLVVTFVDVSIDRSMVQQSVRVVEEDLADQDKAKPLEEKPTDGGDPIAGRTVSVAELEHKPAEAQSHRLVDQHLSDQSSQIGTGHLVGVGLDFVAENEPRLSGHIDQRVEETDHPVEADRNRRIEHQI